LNQKLHIKTFCIILGLIASLCMPGGEQVYGFEASLLDADIGKKAPGFMLSNLSGEKISLDSFKGKPVFLNFWATWCPYCRKERSHLNKLHAEYRDKGLVIISISTDRSGNTLRKFMDNTPADFIVLHDDEGRVSSSYNIMGLPSSLLINREGIIKYKFTGFREWTSEGSKKAIDSLF